MIAKAPEPLARHPKLDEAQDFYALRRKGIEFIEKLGSAAWTDYNVHDPGITILEQVCYAITDIAYRMDWDVESLLAPQLPPADAANPYPHQAFFTARRILTTNPVTVDDYRRLLIDADAVRNAWLSCRPCACETVYFAWCEADGTPKLTFAPPAAAVPSTELHARGLYDITVGLESDPVLGDLNDRKITARFSYCGADALQPVTLELRFPDVSLTRREQWLAFLGSEALGDPPPFTVTLKRLGATPGFDLFTGLPDDAARDAYLRSHWRDLFFLTLTVTAPDTSEVVTFENVTLRAGGSSAARDLATAADWKARLEDKDAKGILQSFRTKARMARDAVAAARKAYASHRNLCEDVCSVSTLCIEDVAVCADIDVELTADIERVQAEVWFALMTCFDPPVPFRSLSELQAQGVASEDIFNGPELAHGFITDADLAAAVLRRDIRTSDLLNVLMDIPGVVAVNGLLHTKYDAEGRPVKGAADPQWVNGSPVFDPKKQSASWQLFIGAHCQPRLYAAQSRFLFFKNGLPSTPRLDEAEAVLAELTGSARRAAEVSGPLDLPVPRGTYRNPAAYTLIQHGLPPVYGVSPAGLPSTASDRRVGQASNLKAYLMVYEQLLANMLSQLGHVADLFSLDPAIAHSYFATLVGDPTLEGIVDTVALKPDVLQSLVETPAEFLDRRNHFLDHLLARFGESFAAFGLLLGNAMEKSAAEERLIGSKLAFLTNYPALSHDRARAFDHTKLPPDPADAAGVKLRIELLLGAPPLAFGGRADDPARDAAKLLVVEHLLLRPKFPGDALLPACADCCCNDCAEDPYSFRLTYVMPGWSDYYSANVDLRRYAERTIQEETPAHLLAKICWVGNDGAAADPCAPIITSIAAELRSSATKADGTTPTLEEACAAAAAIEAAFRAVFDAWIDGKTLTILPEEAFRQQIDALFAAAPQPDAIASPVQLGGAVWARVTAAMTDWFTAIAVNGWQFDRFAHVWNKWLAADAAIDWSEERLEQRLVAILKAGLAGTAATPHQLCACARAMLRAHGESFATWLDAAIAAGTGLDALGPPPEQAAAACPGLVVKPGTLEAAAAVLNARYAAYRDVSYWLRLLLQRLGSLRNVYPAATLHDCDDGSDINPVRLGATALGSAALRTDL